MACSYFEKLSYRVFSIPENSTLRHLHKRNMKCIHKKDLSKNAHISFIDTNQLLETAQMSIYRRMDK